MRFSKKNGSGVKLRNKNFIFVNSDVIILQALSVGAIRPKPRHKGLFEKSPLESQKFHQNKVVCFVQSSLAHLSPKERCVRIFKALF